MLNMEMFVLSFTCIIFESYRMRSTLIREFLCAIVVIDRSMSLIYWLPRETSI